MCIVIAFFIIGGLFGVALFISELKYQPKELTTWQKIKKQFRESEPDQENPWH